MYCPNCKQEVPETAKVCGFCGTKLEKDQKARFCGECGAEVPAGIKFCGTCGASMVTASKPAKKAKPASPAETPAEVPAEAKEPPKPSPKEIKEKLVQVEAVEKPARVTPAAKAPSTLPKWLLPVLFGALAVLAVTLFFVFRPKSQAETAAQEPAPPAAAPKVASPQGEEVSFFVASCSDSLVISEQDTLKIQAGWLAATEEQVEDFLDAVVYDLALNGDKLTFDDRSEIYENEEGYKVDFFVQYGPLSADTYTLEVHEYWREVIWDGWDEYGPGTEFEEFFFTCQIIVE